MISELVRPAGLGCLILYSQVPSATAASSCCIERSVAELSDADDTTWIFSLIKPWRILSWYLMSSLEEILFGIACAAAMVGATLGSGIWIHQRQSYGLMSLLGKFVEGRN
jgi:hypothetical protein